MSTQTCADVLKEWAELEYVLPAKFPGYRQRTHLPVARQVTNCKERDNLMTPSRHPIEMTVAIRDAGICGRFSLSRLCGPHFTRPFPLFFMPREPSRTSQRRKGYRAAGTAESLKPPTPACPETNGTLLQR